MRPPLVLSPKRQPPSPTLPKQETQDKKLRRGIKQTEKKFEEAAYNAATAEILLPEGEGFLEAEGMEKTFKFTQDELKV